MGLAACFSLVANCEYRDRVTGIVVAGDIAAVAKGYREFPKRRIRVVDGSSDLRLRTKQLDGLDDGRSRTLCRKLIFRPQEFAQTFQVTQCRRGKSYLWHVGAGSSLSSPQLSSQAVTSAASACMPVV